MVFHSHVDLELDPARETNLCSRDHNILLALAGEVDRCDLPSTEKISLWEDAVTTYLTFADKDWRLAEQAALSWVQVGGLCEGWVRAAVARSPVECDEPQIRVEVTQFLQTRLENNTFPNQKRARKYKALA